MMSCINMLLEHNFRCRIELLAVLVNLSDEEFNGQQNIGWNSIRGILVHLVNTELYWVGILQGQEPMKYSLRDLTDIEEIKEVWREVEKDTRRFLETQTEVSLQFVKSVTWDDRLVSFTVAKALIHMATHETHHRGLIVGLLRKMGYDPPQVSML